MIEEINNNPEAAVTEDTPVEEQVIPQEEAAKEESKPNEGGYQAKNFKTLRDAREKAESERDAAIAKYRELESKQQVSVKEDVSDDDFLREDDFVEARHVKKVNSEVKKLQKE